MIRGKKTAQDITPGLDGSSGAASKSSLWYSHRPRGKEGGSPGEEKLPESSRLSGRGTRESHGSGVKIAVQCFNRYLETTQGD